MLEKKEKRSGSDNGVKYVFLDKFERTRDTLTEKIKETDQKSDTNRGELYKLITRINKIVSRCSVLLMWVIGLTIIELIRFIWWLLHIS